VGLWMLPVRFITSKGFRAVAFFRMANWLYRHGVPLLPQVLTVINEEVHSAAIHYKAEIGPGLTLPHPFGVVVGPGAKIGRNVQLFQGVGIGPVKGAFPTLGDDVAVFPHAQVLGGVRIGDRARIGANCTVLVDVEADYSVAPPRIAVFKNTVEADGG
ncbi:MAG: hypothetical protein HUU29_08985, partial [Planctomycetaceae bacterium]|nr:hypothetical protein [Planctomycetaceae bacterium]